MKKLILVVMAISSLSSMARTRTVTPAMLLENGFEFQSTKVTDICVNADGNFETLAKRKCVEYRRNFRSRFEYLEADNGCKKFGSLTLFANATKQVGECVEWQVGGEDAGCTRIEYRTVVRPLTYEIKKHKLVRENGDWELGKVVSSELFTIPACN